MRNLGLTTLIALAFSCSSSHDAISDGDGDAAISVDTGTESDGSMMRDSGETRPDAHPVDAEVIDATVTVDAGGTADAGREGWVPLTNEEVECLGLDDPTCAGCHLRDDTFFLLPGDAPPPPPGMMGSTPEECGVDR
jgi:hypothetical protein